MSTTKKKPAKKRVKAGTSKMSAADRRKAFVEAFLSNGGNATQAALQAGYSAGGAAKQGYRMSKDPAILSELDKRRTEIVANLELSTEKTLREVGRLAYCDPRRIMHEDGRVKMLHELDDDTAAAVASFEVSADGTIKYKFWDKNSALEKSSKVQGLYEKDNKQKTDPLRDLLGALSGNVVGVVKQTETED